MDTDIAAVPLDLPVRVLTERIRDGSLSAEAAVAAYVARAKAIRGRLNAIAVPLFDSALATARSAGQSTGMLAGVPISIKEQFLVAGTASTWGLARRASHRALTEGTLVRRLRAAGAILIGTSAD